MLALDVDEAGLDGRTPQGEGSIVGRVVGETRRGEKG